MRETGRREVREIVKSQSTQGLEGLEKRFDFIQNVLGLSLEYLIYFLKESFRLLTGKHN